ncbi:hypothetical protein PENANT_c006G00325 [Penicillium antarcticum]|uniref:Uncharacterized protein n=1 Tax=Penicillium antarcticum TaxID=416450 RepID=A0A1V6QDQ5_9EURO|nr:uncharacterized protein N7508_009383 [Penicillium antarcticum]KAJ5294562.1 hypothetical protein N7508_009383 [Penicillium antarcticum]OQD87172.1 hypothetical protein PENANT_c006G00325 [Penicillium antarcticum]
MVRKEFFAERDEIAKERRRLQRERNGFTADPENGVEYYKISFGCPAPSHEMIKEFIRWYIGSTEGRLNENG